MWLLFILQPKLYSLCAEHTVHIIKTSGSELRGQEEAACARHQAYATATVSYYTDESSNFFKCCSSATVTAIA